MDSVQNSASRAVLEREELQNMRGGVNTTYGVEPCNQILDAAKQLAIDDLDIIGSLDALGPLGSELLPYAAGRVAAEANVILAKLSGMVRAAIALHMDSSKRQQLGV
jgi:hypothetical protein